VFFRSLTAKSVGTKAPDPYTERRQAFAGALVIAARVVLSQIMKTVREARQIIDKLEGQHPDPDTELHYRNAFELLVATILSAQSTDQRVNLVTPALFKRYPNAKALAKATAAEIEPQIHSTGFFRAKSKAIVGMAQALVKDHGGEVPADITALTELPGVGRKTANVVLGHALGVPGLPVDRHVLRVANRIGIASSDKPDVVEQQLCGALPPKQWTRASDALILHGRRVCKPKPLCDQCAVQEDCDYFRTVIARERPKSPLKKLRETRRIRAPRR
jgi:endonuclease III